MVATEATEREATAVVTSAEQQLPTREFIIAADAAAYLRENSLMALCNQIVVLAMRSYPEPEDAIGQINAKGAIPQANAH